ncbi:threonine/serine exporter family protein, partial [Phocaeicola vulgatus]|uniref:threonine/serine exporter family protein n=1 Tax=Phocaeicola vulgatus TaxID=821 RepID=UPI002109BCE7
ISKISYLSSRAIEQDYSLDNYEEDVEKIARQERNYTRYVVAICTGFAGGGFCKLVGGDWIAFLIKAICTFVGFRTRA